MCHHADIAGSFVHARSLLPATLLWIRHRLRGGQFFFVRVGAVSTLPGWCGGGPPPSRVAIVRQSVLESP